MVDVVFKARIQLQGVAGCHLIFVDGGAPRVDGCRGVHPTDSRRCSLVSTDVEAVAQNAVLRGGVAVSLVAERPPSGREADERATGVGDDFRRVDVFRNQIRRKRGDVAVHRGVGIAGQGHDHQTRRVDRRIVDESAVLQTRVVAELERTQGDLDVVGRRRRLERAVRGRGVGGCHGEGGVDDKGIDDEGVNDKGIDDEGLITNGFAACGSWMTLARIWGCATLTAPQPSRPP